jgi:hypothetical protein
MQVLILIVGARTLSSTSALWTTLIVILPQSNQHRHFPTMTLVYTNNFLPLHLVLRRGVQHLKLPVSQLWPRFLNLSQQHEDVLIPNPQMIRMLRQRR